MSVDHSAPKSREASYIHGHIPFFTEVYQFEIVFFPPDKHIRRNRVNGNILTERCVQIVFLLLFEFSDIQLFYQNISSNLSTNTIKDTCRHSP